MKISLAYSPCPNDTFMFDAMVNQKIDTEGLKFEVCLKDVEALNNDAFNEVYDVSKVSFNAFLDLTASYQLLKSGSALGNNCGPILISKIKDRQLDANSKIAIPGIYTTANMLLTIARPDLKNKIPCLFSEIEQKVLSEEIDGGLIIHENRFTYRQKGLYKLIDLGEFWEQKTNLPIPLGGIIVKKSIDLSTKLKLERVMKRSIEFAFEQPDSSSNYVIQHAQEMDVDIVKSHISLYVNQFSIELGTIGIKAIERLFKEAKVSSKNIFIS
jgi:1,4-dihydroxy-6-naphthoate synthase